MLWQGVVWECTSHRVDAGRTDISEDQGENTGPVCEECFKMVS